MAKENEVGENSKPNKTGAIESNYSPSKNRKYSLTFKQNRSFDLHVGNTCINFEPRQTRTVEEWIVNHLDFPQVAEYFVIKEIQ